MPAFRPSPGTHTFSIYVWDAENAMVESCFEDRPASFEGDTTSSICDAQAMLQGIVAQFEAAGYTAERFSPTAPKYLPGSGVRFQVIA